MKKAIGLFMVLFIFRPVFAQGAIISDWSDLIGIALLAVIGLTILYFIVRWFWGVNKIQTLLQSQVNILKAMAEKQGVTFEQPPKKD